MKFNTFTRKAGLIKIRLQKIHEECQSIANQLEKAGKEPNTLSKHYQEKLIAHEGLSKEKYNEFETLVDQLLSDVKEDDEDYKQEVVVELQEGVYDYFVNTAAYIRSLLPPKETPILGHTNTSEPYKEGSSTIVKLPRLELPNFNSDLSTWMTFYNVFQTTIIQNAGLAEVQKFQYLLASLQGEALNLIRQLPLTNSNFKIAWDLLCRRFHNKRRLLSLHLNRVIDLPNVPKNSLKCLRHFLSTYQENVQALSALEHDISKESPLLVTLLLRKIDVSLRKKFEDNRTEHDLPTVEDLIKFLEHECITTEESFFINPSAKSSEAFKNQNPTSQPYQQTSSHRMKTSLFVSSRLSCNYCHQENHNIYQCVEFQAKSPQERQQLVKSNGWCTNCLGKSHQVLKCDSKHRCRICFQQHHTLIHVDSVRSQSNTQHSPHAKPNHNTKSFDRNSRTNSNISYSSIQKPHHKLVTPQTYENEETSNQKVVALSREVQRPHSRVLLGTALVKVTYNGVSHVLRGCLDSAAMATFISHRAAQLLKVKRTYTPKYIQGISSTPVKSLGFTELTISSLNDNFVSPQVNTIILEKITSNLPDTQISHEVKKRMKSFLLADPTFDLPSQIDILIGADLFPLLLTGDNFSLGSNLPTAVGTSLGYVLMGTAPVHKPQDTFVPTHLTLLFIQDIDLNETLLKFWQTEEPPNHHNMSEDDGYCEEFFINSFSRDEFGRFTVRLPRKPGVTLSESSTIAKRQFSSLENKLTTQPDFKNLYHDFMKDYKTSGHMVLSVAPTDEEHYYLPHHGVIKENSSTTKLRVVFNASQKTSNGCSLNDMLVPGPKLQNDICDVLLNFRHHSVVFICDIKQMYRQIKVHVDDQRYQLIYWRDSPTDALETYTLTTVTYGLSCSPYLAIRTIQQLVKEDGHQFPRAAEVLRSQIYMDDCLAGAPSIEDAIYIQSELRQLLQKGGFSLRKWISNRPQLLDALPKEHLEIPLKFTNSTQPLFNVLGLYWNPDTDSFFYKIEIQDSQPCTKRSALATLARLYDPCGILSPVIFWAKSFIQLLWTQGLKWDDLLPPQIGRKWASFLKDLPLLENISILRPIFTDSAVSIQLHGFCDASELGFAANVYLRCINKNGDIKVSLLFAKSRVAPLKRISLPRLELNGAHLLAKIMHYCNTTLSNHIKIDSVYAWCDSTVTIAWIQTPSYRLRTYIANRVAQIQEWLPPVAWAHIKSAENPADCASRGLQPSQLIHHHLWWSGPEWLILQCTEWPKSKITIPDIESLPEVKPTCTDVLVTSSTASSEQFDDILTRYSSWTKLRSIMAIILRFIHNCRSQKKLTGQISINELHTSTLVICRLIQEQEFTKDLVNLKKGKICSSRLQRLAPFIDNDGLIHVGGRLRNSQLSPEAKHPILLPKAHPVTTLIIDHFHIKHLHAGPQLLQSLLTQQYWILSARSIIRSRVFRCNRCFRCKPTLKPPLMGDLPESRITPARPFSRTGIDFGGPLYIKMHLQRRIQSIKVYLCIFVCFTTKAVHLEIVTDLTSDAFIAALTRFISRRGICNDIYSDCGTNLVGASNKLKGITQEFFSQEDNQSSLQHFSTQNSIKFHFNPPAAPHQGGLWESAIKSAKYHLLRVVGDYVMTLEELITLTAKVEAILNSRPLTVLLTDPSEPAALTPGHFLIGAPLVALPEPQLDETPLNRVKRWQMVQVFSQRIWKRWNLEYLHSLQQRTKWTQKNHSLQPGDVVIVHEPDTPPLHWNLGKVESVFPGPDGVVRVVQVKTPRGLLRRPAIKVFRLPQDD